MRKHNQQILGASSRYGKSCVTMQDVDPLEGQQRAGRPYRSHLQPACQACKKRKSRCQSDETSSACPMCRNHETDCSYLANPASQRLPRNHRRLRNPTRSQEAPVYPESSNSRSIMRSKNTRNCQINSAASCIVQKNGATRALNHGSSPSITNHLRPRNSEGTTFSQSMLASQAIPHSSLTQPLEELPSNMGYKDDHQLNLHVVGPAGTSDSQVLSDYLSGIPGSTTRSTRMIIPVPASGSRPVLFTTVQKRPVGITLKSSPSAEKLEIIEKLIEPHKSQIIDE